MIEFNDIIEKLKDIVSAKKPSGKIFDKDVATELGIPQATFATMKKRKTIPYPELLEYCAKKKLSINWLLFDQTVEMLSEETNKFFNIRYFPDIRASAGGGAEVFAATHEVLTIDEKLLKGITGNNRDIDAINVDGESMEPTLKDGAIVFIDRNQTNINKDGIFVAATNAGLFIKRIRQRVDGMVELISDNKAYSPEVLHASEIQIVGKVVGNVESI